MKRLLTTAAVLVALTSAAAAKDKMDTAMTGLSQGTEEGRTLAIETGATTTAHAPVKMSKVQEDLMAELVLHNGGMQNVWANAKMTDEAIKSVGKDKWCAAYKQIMDLVEKKMPATFKEALK